MHFNLATLLSSEVNLTFMEAPFTTQEMNNVVSGMPTNKSLGPDGLNTGFFKKCWPIIQCGFYKLCSSFHPWVFVIRVLIDHISL